MASIRKEVLIEAPPGDVWAAVRDVGAVHQRLARGFVVETKLDGDARIVTFANGFVVREMIVILTTGLVAWPMLPLEGALATTMRPCRCLPMATAALASSGSPMYYQTRSRAPSVRLSSRARRP